MDPRMLPVLLLLAICTTETEAEMETSHGRWSRRDQSLSERLIMPDDSEPSRNYIQDNQQGKTTEPPMTFRGRAPSRSATTASPIDETTTQRWYRRLVPSELPRFMDRVGQFLGRRRPTTTTETALSSTTESSGILESSEEEGQGGDRVNGNYTLDDFDIRVMIDAPSINGGSCPSGQRRSRSGRCRPIL